MYHNTAPKPIKITNPVVQELYEKVKELNAPKFETAEHAIYIDIPTKILELNKLLKEDPRLQPQYVEKVIDEYMKNIMQKRDELSADYIQEPKAKAKISGDDFFGAIMKSSKEYTDLTELIKAEIPEIARIMDALKIWIQLNVPKIEDGNNFGVEIIGELLGELSRIEDAAFSLRNDFITYYAARSKIVTKLLKYPFCEDYLRSLIEIDTKELLNVRVIFNDIFNNYNVFYDMLLKNIDKIRAPKGNPEEAQQLLNTMY